MQGFSNVAEELGFKVGLKHKKINISNPRVSRYTWNFELLTLLIKDISIYSCVLTESFHDTGLRKNNKLSSMCKIVK